MNGNHMLGCASGTLIWRVLTVRERASITAALCIRPPSGGFGAQVAQLVEHVTENHGVGGSIPPLGTSYFNHLDEISHF